MAHGIKLTRSAATLVNHRYLGAYRVRLEASERQGFDGRPFLYLRGPLEPYTREPTDYYVGVASPADVAEWPADAPRDTDSPAFFRLTYVELDYRSTKEALDAAEDIHLRVCVLIEALDRLAELSVVAEYTCGTPAEVSSESSEGSSDSSESSSESPTSMN